jgi:aldose 1-epimerase
MGAHLETKSLGKKFMNREKFQKTIKGKNTDLYFIGNDQIKVELSNYGARIISIQVKNKNNKFIDVVYNFESLDEFINADCPYYGATIGRFANRIAFGKFTLDNSEYQLKTNDGDHHLHGGPGGFHQAVWDAFMIDDHALEFKYHSKDMEEGYPGNLIVSVKFSVTGPALKIEYQSTCDKKTIINLTNHTFFNLNGKGSGDILSHKLEINADAFTSVDSGLIPTGELAKVDEGPFDFRTPKAIGERINDEHLQLKPGLGYDHNFILNIGTAEDMHPAASVVGDLSGIKMNILTTEPGLQFYSGNFMKAPAFRHAFALETQHFPDSPNQSKFPKVELAHQSFLSTSIYQFTTEGAT